LSITITLPRSKSIVIRCLIIHYLRTGELLPVFENDPNDIKIVYNALKKISENANVTCNSLLVTKNNNSQLCEIDVQDCGAAYRFLMALLATTPGNWLLTGTKRLLERPILPLVNYLIERGAIIEKTDSGWRIEGQKLQIDNCEIDTSETSQFMSAVMMVKGMRYEVRGGEKKSPSNFEGVDGEAGRGSLYQNPYIRMTDTILQTNNLIESQFLKLADWSAAVFWIANALLIPNAHYFLKDLHFDRLQGDAAIVPFFLKWGLSFTEKKNGIEVKHINNVEISPQIINVTPMPDITIILAVLAVCYPFELTLFGLKNLNLKESNRLDILVNELSKFTKVKKESENSITIYKRKKPLPQQFHFDSYNDHRFVMAWSLFKNYGEVNIENSECVRKSYPNFIEIV